MEGTTVSWYVRRGAASLSWMCHATTMLLCALLQVTQPLGDTCPICGNRRPVLEAPVPSLPAKRVVIYLVPKWEKEEGTAPYAGAGVPVLLHPTMDLARQLENAAFILRRRRHTEVMALKVRKKQLQLGVFCITAVD